MAIEFRAEYRLGRTGQVARTYRGPAAAAAIAVDLALGTLIGTVSLACRLAWWAARTVVATLYLVLASPFRVARWVARQFERPRLERPSLAVPIPMPMGKPAWAGVDDL